jgi:dolichol-phosphate mannosyltransferase
MSIIAEGEKAANWNRAVATAPACVMRLGRELVDLSVETMYNRGMAASKASMEPTRIAVVVPTYNEAENLPALAGELLALCLPGLSIVIVDDNSPDGTGRVADELAGRYPGRFHVLHRSGRLGLGTAYVAGFRYALEQGADYIVQMDADFSHSPRYIPQFVKAVAAYDVVIGSRYVSGGTLDERWGWWRNLLSWWANSVYTRLILGLRARDVTAGFKCWKRATLEGIGLERIRSNGYVFQVEMAFLTERLGYRFLEIPIHFEDRRIGRSKMSMRVKVEAALHTWKIRRLHRHAKRA